MNKPKIIEGSKAKNAEDEKYSDSELSGNFSVDDCNESSPPYKKQKIQDSTYSVTCGLIYEMKLELHESISHATCTLSSTNEHNIRISV